MRGTWRSPRTERFTCLKSDPNAQMDDMEVVDCAAFDPSLYPHHANLDRVWEVWKTAGGRGNRVDIADEDDYQTSQFVFFDENQRLVSIKSLASVGR